MATRKPKNRSWLALLILIALGITAIIAASYLANPSNQFTGQSKASYALENVGKFRCEMVTCWVKLLEVQKKYLNKQYTYLGKVQNLGKALGGEIKACIVRRAGQSFANQLVNSLTYKTEVLVNEELLGKLESCLENPFAELATTPPADPTPDAQTKERLVAEILNKLGSLNQNTLRACLVDKVGEREASRLENLVKAYGKSAASYVSLETLLKVKSCFGL